VSNRIAARWPPSTLPAQVVGGAAGSAVSMAAEAEQPEHGHRLSVSSARLACHADQWDAALAQMLMSAIQRTDWRHHSSVGAINAIQVAVAAKWKRRNQRIGIRRVT
jgi:hypothetical protein